MTFLRFVWWLWRCRLHYNFLRIGQLLINACDISDPFYVTDEELITYLKNSIKGFTQ